MDEQKIQEIRKRVGHRIKLYRVDRNLDQGDLAARIGMKQSQLSEIERGIRSLKVEQLVEIAEALDCTSAELLAGLPGEKGKRAAPDTVLT